MGAILNKPKIGSGGQEVGLNGLAAQAVRGGGGWVLKKTSPLPHTAAASFQLIELSRTAFAKVGAIPTLASAAPGNLQLSELEAGTNDSHKGRACPLLHKCHPRWLKGGGRVSCLTVLNHSGGTTSSSVKLGPSTVTCSDPVLRTRAHRYLKYLCIIWNCY